MSSIPKPARCVFYVRYSTEDQSSTAPQLRVCEGLAKRHGFTEVNRYADEAISGGAVRKRVGYQQMIAAARRSEFEYVVAEDSSRLWRNLAEQAPRIAELSDLGIHVVTHDLDTRDENADLLGPVQGAINQRYRKEIARRTRRTLHHLACGARPAGGRSYGYKPGVDPATGQKIREKLPQEVEVIKQIFQWRADGWSVARMARELNARGVPPPGATWSRVDKGANRKNPAKGWTTSCIAGDPRRGTGILNNELYHGVQVWGRTKWIPSAMDSGVRRVEHLPPEAWVREKRPQDRILDEELWQKVEKIQKGTNPVREAVRRGIAKRKSGHARPYWLGSILVCSECGSNYCGHGRLDYACGSFTVGKCSNAMRFRREAVHKAMFNLVKEHLLSEEAIARGLASVKAKLEEQAREEEKARLGGTPTAELKRLDEEAAELYRKQLRPSAIAASLADIEREREEILRRAARCGQEHQNRALRLLSRLPQIAVAYRKQIEKAVKVLARVEVVEEAREALRSLLANGQVILSPNLERTAVAGAVHFKTLGDHLLETGGQTRRVGVINSNGSGGRI